MLRHLQIRDLAIIEAVDIEFGPGLTVLTGETGAGKSMLIDALELLCGGRAAADVVRQGAERADNITGVLWIEYRRPIGSRRHFMPGGIPIIDNHFSTLRTAGMPERDPYRWFPRTRRRPQCLPGLRP